MNKIRVGIIGFGYWGPNLARNFHDVPESEIAAIADVREERLQRAHGLYPGVCLETDYHKIEALALNYKRSKDYQAWINELRSQIYWQVKGAS